MLIIKSFFLSYGSYGHLLVVLYSKHVSHDNMLILRASNEHLKTITLLFKEDLLYYSYCCHIEYWQIWQMDRSLSAHMYSATAASDSIQGLKEWALSHRNCRIYTPPWQLPDTPSLSIRALRRQTQACEAVQRNIIETDWYVTCTYSWIHGSINGTFKVCYTILHL